MSDRDADSNKGKRPLYDSPSRLSIITPVRSALRSSNNNVSVFLDKLQQLNKFKKGIEKLSVEKSRKEGAENDAPSTL